MSVSCLPLVLFAVVATIMPGGATTLATASGARCGFRRSVPLMMGIALGLASLEAFAALGLGTMLRVIPALETIVKAVGSAYLLWLAWRIARSGPMNEGQGPERPVTRAGGTMLLWLNPKIWPMTLGAAASFALLADSPVRLAVVLAGAFGVAACASLALWCAVGSLLAQIFRIPRQWLVLNLVMASLLAASVVASWF